MAGKHYRTSSAAEPRHNAERPKVQPQKKEDYEDLYSYEEPYGAKRGTRQSKNRPHGNVNVKAPAKKESTWPTVAAWLCLLAAAGILGFIVWDMGLLDMVRSLLG